MRISGLFKKLFIIVTFSLLASCSGTSETTNPTTTEIPTTTTEPPTTTTEPPTTTTEIPTTTTEIPTTTTEIPATYDEDSNHDEDSNYYEDSNYDEDSDTTAAPIWSAPTPETSNGYTPTIEINNYSSFSDDEIRQWTELASSKMNWWHANLTAFVWPIGKLLGEGNCCGHDGDRFNTFEVALTSEQVEELSTKFETFATNAPCINPGGVNFGGWQRLDPDGVQRVLSWITGGGDAATAPDPCFDERGVLYAFPSESTYSEGRHTYIHELYHALSSYLQSYCTRGGEDDTDKYERLRWVGEGTAHYFAYYVAGEIEGLVEPFNRMFEIAYLGGRDGESIDTADNAAAALRLMVERGDLTENEIIDGSIFETCDWPAQWQTSDPAVAFAKNNWMNIEIENGQWGFTSEALNG